MALILWAPVPSRCGASEVRGCPRTQDPPYSFKMCDPRFINAALALPRWLSLCSGKARAGYCHGTFVRNRDLKPEKTSDRAHRAAGWLSESVLGNQDLPGARPGVMSGHRVQ